METLTFEQCSFAYGRGPLVLDRLDLAIKPGEMLAVIGPNGAGKSTLLKLAAGLVRPTAGRVMLDGVDLTAMTDRKRARRLCLVGLRQGFAPTLTVEQYVALGRAPCQGFLGVASSEDIRKTRQAMELAGVAHLHGRPLHHLSGGEEQMVRLAQAFAQDAPLLLLDEPSRHLDLGRLTGLFDLLRRRNRQEGLTVVAVLHDLLLAAAYFDRVVAFSQGRTALDGPPGQCLDTPAISRLYGTPARLTITHDHASLALKLPEHK